MLQVNRDGIEVEIADHLGRPGVGDFEEDIDGGLSGRPLLEDGVGYSHFILLGSKIKGIS
jgi:hypothetical protein